ncbi:hypothetical protein F5Y08DRAFT_339705 [Xylaria arbuscula]|nr:hypothetical protein F5Y08DRAFT_339705 [Xylaria arbuscula]
MASKEKSSPEVRLEERHIGPIPFLHQTCRHELASTYQPVTTATAAPTTTTVTGIWRRYQTRDNRKGRHAVVISPESAAKQGLSHPHPSGTFQASLRGIRRMFVRYPVFDVSYDVAVIFTLGSLIWVINGFFAWLPVQWPYTEFVGEEGLGVGITALIGTTVFELGSVLLVLEAVNERRTDCFGWALEEAMESHGLVLRPDLDNCAHHHPDRHGLLTPRDPEAGKEARSWQWWPTWEELRTHYFKEIGFLASFAQLLGATVFWIGGFTSLPSIQDRLSTPAVNGTYWLPQVVGGVGFIISGWLFMVETQKTWYTPAPKILGWHIAFWNLIGAIGFTICGAAGFSSNQAAVYTADLSTFIGSWAFLIGSVIQWYESLDKYPVRLQ